MLILKQFHHYQEWLLLTAKRVALGTERSKSNKSTYWLSKALLNLSITVSENFQNLLMVQYFSSDCIWVYLIMQIIQFSYPGCFKPWADGCYNSWGIHAQASIYFISNAC